MEGHEYEGVRFMIDCHLDKLKQTIKIDISTGDEITPRAVAYKLPLIVEDRTIDLWAYNLETLLAEKLETFENICYLTQNGAGHFSLIFFRGFGTGAMHVICGVIALPYGHRRGNVR